MKYLSDYIQDKQSAALNELGAFFAFSNEQFEKVKKQGVRYFHLGAGLICPVDNANELVKRLEEIGKEGIVRDIKENGKEAIIRRELFNLECFYSNDICACVERLEEYGYSYDDIYQVFSHIRNTEDVY